MRPLALLCLVAMVGYVACHGRVYEPPSRASAWRFGFKTPRNDNDNELYCGGFTNQQNHGGKCGVCGDPYQGPREHEAGGKYATGTIVRRYRQGDTMPVQVHITANHKGWMEFRLCPNNNPKKAITHDCLNRHLLTIAGTGQTRFKVTSDMRLVDLVLELPRDVRCSQCVLQWKYHAGNSWGTDPDTGRGCLGCGPQEEFYACSDIAIGNYKPRPTIRPPVRVTTQRPVAKTTPPRSKSTPRRPPIPVKCGLKCCAIGKWAQQNDMHKWCDDNCRRGYCPSTHCACR